VCAGRAVARLGNASFDAIFFFRVEGVENREPSTEV